MKRSQVTAAGSALLGVVVGVLTNIATDGWPLAVVAALVVAAIAWVALEFWRAGGAEDDGGTSEEDTIDQRARRVAGTVTGLRRTGGQGKRATVRQEIDNVTAGGEILGVDETKR
ncbi:hypothetical protein [Actinoplanes sp. NBRC 101535]|uniref:hypothetical protein n=1 Tax=Actinoplanes sp. NBRC 101535 TaxID=3032196 RepID=UPI002553FFB6|nr:hypothetical protein [Actinoplanes sp. NBRC 101535]